MDVTHVTCQSVTYVCLYTTPRTISGSLSPSPYNISDYDWYKFRTTGCDLAWKVSGTVVINCNVALYDSTGKLLEVWCTPMSLAQSASGHVSVRPDTDYYIMVDVDTGITIERYNIELSSTGEPAPPPALVSLSVLGPEDVRGGNLAKYTCTAAYADGSQRGVAPNWSIVKGDDYAVMSDSGVMRALSVYSPHAVTIQAQYAEGSVAKTVTFPITVSPEATSDDFTLNPITATCVSGVATGHFSVQCAGEWSASPDVTWVSLETSSGFGPGDVYYKLTANTSSQPRSAAIRVVCGEEVRTFTVRQEGTGNNATVTFSLNGVAIQAHRILLSDKALLLNGYIMSMVDVVVPLILYCERSDSNRYLITRDVETAVRSAVDLVLNGRLYMGRDYLIEAIKDSIAYRGWDATEMRRVLEDEPRAASSMRNYETVMYDLITDIRDITSEIEKLDLLEQRPVRFGSAIGALPDPGTFAGYSFDGWWMMYDGEPIRVTSSTMIWQDTTVFAKWVEPTPVVVPTAPEEVQASDGTLVQAVRVEWQAVSGADSYEIYRASSSTGEKSKIGTSETVYYTDSTVDLENYWYFVKAVNAAGVSDFSMGDCGYAKDDAGGTATPTYGPWGEAEAVKNPDKLGPTMLTDMTLELNGAAGAVGDVVAAFRGDTGALCGLGKVMDGAGTLSMVCYAPTGTKLHFKVWVAASGVENPVVVDCDAKSDLTAPTSGAFLSGHALVVSDDKDLTISLGSADWHTVSFNVLPEDPSPAAVFGSVKAKIAAVTQGIEFWMPGKSSSLKAIEIGKGYWVNTKVDDVEWTVSGKTDPKAEIALEEGWNLVGYAPEAEGAVQAVLKTALAAKAVDYVTYGVEFYPGGTLKKMEPGKAYWVHAKKAYTLVYDEVGTQVKAARVLSAPRGEDAAGTALEPTYGPWGESEAVKNPDKLGPTFLTDMAVEIDGEPAVEGDVVAVFRGDTGALCGLGKVMDDSGTLTVVCYAPKGVTLSFKVWLAESGMDEPVIVKCDKASKLVAPESGAFYDGHAISASTEESAETIVTGEKVTIDTEFVGYKAVGLPSGLKYDAKTGKITGAAKAATAAEGVVVKFTKKEAEDEELTIVVRAEEISAGCEGLSSGPLPAGVAGAAGGIDIQVDSEGGTKSVSVTKLPSGMKYDKKSGKITGAPTKAGDYEVVLTVTTAYGNKETVKIPVSVAAMPVMAVGTFSGFVSVGEDNLGTVTLTTTDAGKLTAKVVTAAGTVSFSGTCWDAVEKGVYRATLTTKKGEKLTLTLDSTAAWDVNQLSGAFTTAVIAETKKTAAVPSRTYSVSAQRNAFGKTWYFAATGDETAGWKFAYTEDTKGAALTVTLKADGSTSIAGKLPNGTDAKGKSVTIKVSASGYANVGGLKDGAILADFTPVLTVNKVKTVLAIKTNLWFDRTNDHAEGAGDARFVK